MDDEAIISVPMLKTMEPQLSLERWSNDEWQKELFGGRGMDTYLSVKYRRREWSQGKLSFTSYVSEGEGKRA